MAEISTAQIAAQQSALGSLVSGSLPLTLVDGRTLDARVQQIIGDGVLRVLTAQGALDIATKVDVAIGSRVRLLILGTTGQISLSLVAGENAPPRLVDPAARIVIGANSPATLVVPRAGDGSAANLRAGLASQPGGALQSVSNTVTQNDGVVVDVRARQPVTAPPATTSQTGEVVAALNAALSSAISSSVAKQGPLAPVFANLAALQQRPRDLPAPLRDAVNKAAAANISLDEGITTNGLIDAIANSGVFLENALAGGNNKTVLSADLKAVLLGLRDQLTKLVPQAGAASVQTAAELGASPEASQAASPEGAARTTGARDQSERLAPPHRGEIPEAQRPASGDIPANAKVDEIASHLLDQTEAALSRIRLSQLVSRHGDQVVPSDQKSQPTLQTSYYVEIPVQIRQQTTTLQVAVEREAQPAGVGGAFPTYRLWFALDSEPAGPVSAVIVWQPGNASSGVSATLWAERETTGRALRDGLSDLRRDLRKADLPIGEVAARLGKPQRPNQGGGHYVDRQT